MAITRVNTKPAIVGFLMAGHAYRNGVRYPGWLQVRLSDGTVKYFGESETLDTAVASLEQQGYEVGDFNRSKDHWIRTGQW